MTGDNSLVTLRSHGIEEIKPGLRTVGTVGIGSLYEGGLLVCTQTKRGDLGTYFRCRTNEALGLSANRNQALEWASGESKVDYLFNVQKVFGLKVDPRALDWAPLIQNPAVADIGPHSKRHRFVLKNLITMAMRDPPSWGRGR